MVKIDEDLLHLGFLNTFDYILTDCDGVLWLGDDPIQGSVETIKTLKDIVKQIM